MVREGAGYFGDQRGPTVPAGYSLPALRGLLESPRESQRSPSRLCLQWELRYTRPGNQPACEPSRRHLCTCSEQEANSGGLGSSQQTEADGLSQVQCGETALAPQLFAHFPVCPRHHLTLPESHRSTATSLQPNSSGSNPDWPQS